MIDKVLIASAWHRHLLFFRRKYPDVATFASAIVELRSFRALKSIGYRPNAERDEILEDRIGVRLRSRLFERPA